MISLLTLVLLLQYCCSYGYKLFAAHGLRAVHPQLSAKVMVSDHGYQDNVLLGYERLIYADDDIIVENKPYYARSVPSREVKDSVAGNVAKTLDLEVDTSIVHRLDYPTSGVLLFARNAAVLRYLHTQFRQRSAEKRYKAIVSGALPEGAQGEIDLPLGKDLERGSPFCKVDFGEFGKHSVTHWRSVGSNAAANMSMVELTPITGRTHQLRIHLAETGHPIVGDCFYAPPMVESMGYRLMLHAEDLCIVHPRTKKHMTFRAKCPFLLEDYG